jgi:hypothetical protein
LGGGGELAFWTPQPRQAGAPNPSWLEKYSVQLNSAAQQQQQQQQHAFLKTWVVVVS